MIKPTISYEDFPEAHKPAYKLWIDFGPDDGTDDSSNWVALTTLKEVPLGRGVK